MFSELFWLVASMANVLHAQTCRVLNISYSFFKSTKETMTVIILHEL